MMALSPKNDIPKNYIVVGIFIVEFVYFLKSANVNEVILNRNCPHSMRSFEDCRTNIDEWQLKESNSL